MPPAIDRRLYARQLLLPEIGEAGQRALCESRLQPTGDAVADDYLRRAGVGLSPEGPPLARDVEARVPAVEALTADDGLREAARALRGALVAVEALKTLLGVGAPLRWPDGLTLDAPAEGGPSPGASPPGAAGPERGGGAPPAGGARP
jgi:hypothetical protein